MLYQNRKNGSILVEVIANLYISASVMLICLKMLEVTMEMKANGTNISNNLNILPQSRYVNQYQLIRFALIALENMQKTLKKEIDPVHRSKNFNCHEALRNGASLLEYYDMISSNTVGNLESAREDLMLEKGGIRSGDFSIIVSCRASQSMIKTSFTENSDTETYPLSVNRSPEPIKLIEALVGENWQIGILSGNISPSAWINYVLPAALDISDQAINDNFKIIIDVRKKSREKFEAGYLGDITLKTNGLLVVPENRFPWFNKHYVMSSSSIDVIQNRVSLGSPIWGEKGIGRIKNDKIGTCTNCQNSIQVDYKE